MCLTASQAPIQQEGYAAGAPLYEGGEPAFIVECSSVLTCPGSLELGKCPGSNSGIACVDCLPDHYQAGGWDGGLEFTNEVEITQISQAVPSKVKDSCLGVKRFKLYRLFLRPLTKSDVWFQFLFGKVHQPIASWQCNLIMRYSVPQTEHIKKDPLINYYQFFEFTLFPKTKTSWNSRYFRTNFFVSHGFLPRHNSQNSSSNDWWSSVCKFTMF